MGMEMGMGLGMMVRMETRMRMGLVMRMGMMVRMGTRMRMGMTLKISMMMKIRMTRRMGMMMRMEMMMRMGMMLRMGMTMTIRMGMMMRPGIGTITRGSTSQPLEVLLAPGSVFGPLGDNQGQSLCEYTPARQRRGRLGPAPGCPERSAPRAGRLRRAGDKSLPAVSPCPVRV